MLFGKYCSLPVTLLAATMHLPLRLCHLQASDGDVKIIGDKQKPKHDLTTGQDRTSATVYRVGSSAGATGPTAFLPPGKQLRIGYDDRFLVRFGAPKGSTIAMTPTGYMTEEAWLEIAPKIAEGIRQMPVVCDRRDWWVIKVIDGFGPHCSSARAMEIYYEQKILLVKEEGDTSHACQAYDQKVAKDDKRSMRDSLAYLREANKMTKGVIDGWALIHVALAAVRELAADSWVYSFNKVNLRPSSRVPFEDWIKRIEHYVQASSIFKPEVLRDPYALLTPFWHGMTPEEKKSTMSIFAAHGNTFNVPCLKQIMTDVHVPASEMQNVRVAMELALKDTSHLERMRPEGIVLEQPVEVQQAQAKVASVNTGLRTFQLHPKDASGAALLTGLGHFDHLVRMARRSVGDGTDLTPSAYLDVEYTSLQQHLINPRAVDYAMHAIAKHASGDGAKQAMATRKLDNLGYLRAESALANDPDRMQRLKNQLQTTESLAAISKETADQRAEKTSADTAKLIDAAPAAVTKLVDNGGDLNKLFVAELNAIAFKYFKGTSLKGNKDVRIKELGELIKQQPGILKLPVPGTDAPPDADAPPAAADAPHTAADVPADVPPAVPPGVPPATAVVPPAAADAPPAAADAPPAAADLPPAADDVPPAAAEVPPAAADVPPAAAQVPPDAADVTPAEEEYTVKCIHDQQGTGRWTKYLVEWEGYEGERTWEPAAHLTDTAALTAWKRHRNQ